MALHSRDGDVSSLAIPDTGAFPKQPESPGQCPGGMSMGEGPRFCLDMVMPAQFAVSWARDNAWEQKDVVADRSVAGASCEGRARPWTTAASC